jgi:4-alpha-glucanotransferase
MILERSSGVLLHITSLPGKHGIGTLGPEAERFADMLKQAGQRYWQILPIGPVDAAFSYSPYASTSTFAGNWLFISLEKLVQNKWFNGDPGPAFKDDHFIQFEEVINHKLPFLEGACGDFFSLAAASDMKDYELFRKDNAYWLDDYALYSSIAEETGSGNWLEWDTALSMREPKTLAQWSVKLAAKIRLHTCDLGKR